MHSFKASRAEIVTIGFVADGDVLLTASASEVTYQSVPEGRPLDTDDERREGTIAYLAPDGELHANGTELVVAAEDDDFQGSAYFTLTRERTAFTADGERFFASLGDGLRQWDVVSGTERPCGWGGTRQSNRGLKFPVGALAAHPAENVLAMSCGVLDESRNEWQAGIEFFEIDTGETLRLLQTPFRYAHIERLLYSPDGRTIVGLNGPMWRAWSVEGGELLAEQECGRKHLRDLAFSPDGGRMVTVGNDTNVRVWSTDDWSEVNGFEWDIGPLTCVAVSPDGTLYAAGSKKGRVVLWDDWP